MESVTTNQLNPAVDNKKVRYALLELVVVGCAAILLVRVTSQHTPHWLVIPLILVSFGLGPGIIRRRGLPQWGLQGQVALRSIKLVSLICLGVLPLTGITLWLLQKQGVPIPLRPHLGASEGLFGWCMYQFLYVATAEEVFFRGYVQQTMKPILPDRLSATGIIVLSAGLFALAHVVIIGQIAAAVTFLPGLIFAWLYEKTNVLLAPILFHGLANIFYGLFLAYVMTG